MKSKNHFSILAISLITLIIIATALFIDAYCDLFDSFGEIAKKRLLDYPLLTFFITPLLFWISAYLCRRFSPNAAGNNMQLVFDQLKQDPDDFKKVSAFLNARLVIVKTISSLVSSFGGGSLGKEGPSIHISTGIFTIFANHFQKILPKIKPESWILAGSAVGLTVVFNAPIAGVIFAAEKLAKIGYKNLKQSAIWVLTAITIVVIIFHKPFPIFILRDINFTLESEWKLLIFTAIICGFLAFILKSSCFFFYQKISNIKSNWWHTIPVTIGLVVACINFYCGIYSFSGGIETLKETFASDTILLSCKEVGGRFFNTILAFSSGSAGGLIAPAMALGAGVGSVVSTLAANTDIGIFLIIGMAAFLSVMLGAPISAAIIIFETTGQNFYNIPFLLGASLISLAVWKILKKGITEQKFFSQNSKHL